MHFLCWMESKNLEEAEKLAEISAKVTHSHERGIKGAQVAAGSIFLLRQGKKKSDVEEYARKYYDLDFILDEIRETYTFDVSCQGSVPQLFPLVETAIRSQEVLQKSFIRFHRA